MWSKGGGGGSRSEVSCGSLPVVLKELGPGGTLAWAHALVLKSGRLGRLLK